MRRDPPPQRLDLGEPPLGIRAGKDQEKLLPAHPGGQPAFADRGGQHQGDRPQDLVADLVGQRVVDPLEVVQVDQRHRQVFGVREQHRQPLVHDPPVEHPGQSVPPGHLLEAPAVLPRLRRVHHGLQRPGPGVVFLRPERHGLGAVQLVLLVRLLVPPLRGVQLRAFGPPTRPQTREVRLHGQRVEPLQRLPRAPGVAAQPLRPGEGQQHLGQRERLGRRGREDRCQRLFDLGVPAELHLGARDRVEMAGTEHDPVGRGQRLHPLRRGHGRLRLPGLVRGVGEIVEDPDPEGDVPDRVRDPLGGAVALQRLRDGPGLGQLVGEPQDMVRTEPRAGVLVQPLHGPDGVLECDARFADAAEEQGQQPVPAGQQMPVAALGGPPVHLTDHPGARGVLAGPAEHVRLDQLGTQPQVLQAEAVALRLQVDRRLVRGVHIGVRHHLQVVEQCREAGALVVHPCARRHGRPLGHPPGRSGEDRSPKIIGVRAAELYASMTTGITMGLRR
jgi:hypothetical protein